MTLSAWPFDGVDTTEVQYGSLFGQFQDDGLQGVPGDAAGQVTPSSGLTLAVAPFALAVAAGVAAKSTASEPVTLAPAGASTRIDRVVLRIDSTSNTVDVDKLTGSAGAGAPPALTQNPGGIYEIPLARVTVAAGAVTVGTANIVDERSWLSQRVGQWTTGTRPGSSGQRAAQKGDFGFNHSTNVFEGWNGSGWGPIGGSGGGSVVGFNSTWPPRPTTSGTVLFISKGFPLAPTPPLADGDYWIPDPAA